MINTIDIKNVASFDEQGTVIQDLKKLNFVFGFNGSGKSTITKFLYEVSLSEEKRNPIYALCSQQGYNIDEGKILVYNDDFVKRNFIKSDELDGIFSLDETNDTVDKLIKEKETERNTEVSYQTIREKNKSNIEKTASDKEKELCDDCFNERKIFDSFFKMPQLKHSGNKKNNLQELRKHINKDATGITLNTLKTDYEKLYEQDIKKVSFNIDARKYRHIRVLEFELSQKLSEIIVGNKDVDIARMIDELDISSWVSSGLDLINQTNGICPFCQKKTIDAELIDKFNKYFDTSYKEKLQDIETTFNEYKNECQDFITEIGSIENVFNPNNIVSSCKKNIEKILEDNEKIITEKLKTPNEKKTIKSIFLFKGELSNIIKEIKDNNTLFSELDSNREKLVSQIWIFMSMTCRSKIESFDKKKNQCDRIISKIDELINKSKEKSNSLKDEIELLRSKTQDTKAAVDNINTILSNSGFSGFSIREKEKVNNISKYQLVREKTCDSASVFESLSEGEKNFIAFLYFYQLCIGTNDKENKGKKIIVIDDPVSSMDSQVLFIVSTLIQNLALYKWEKKGDNNDLKKEFRNGNIDQIIIFTHNFYFYKEVTLDKRPTNTDYNHYLIKKNKSSTIENKGRMRVAVDDYAFMWQTLKEIKSTVTQDKSNNIVIANLMRRIIDSFVGFLGLGNDCWGAINDDELENDSSAYFIKAAFLSDINSESHKVSVLDSIYYQRISQVQPQVLFDVFESIFKTIGKEHYDLMMSN